jgi:hypothetical protein
MFGQNKTVDSALGSALRAGFGVIRNLGGKLIVSQCAMPSVGTAKLRVRDDPKLLGTEKETQLLNPDEPFYKNFALDCSRSQVRAALPISSLSVSRQRRSLMLRSVGFCGCVLLQQHRLHRRARTGNHAADHWRRASLLSRSCARGTLAYIIIRLLLC